MVIYRRFVATVPKDTEIGGTDAIATQGIAVDAASGDIDTDLNTISLTLSGYITAEAGDPITLTDDAGLTDDGVVADSPSITKLTNHVIPDIVECIS